MDIENSNINVLYARQSKERTLDIPPDLLPVLKLGKSQCSAEDYLFQGRFAGKHLSTRMAELILRKAVRSTDILKTVTCMVLRHSYAVHCIEADYSIRAVQEALGHESIDTTMPYEGCILPKDAVSPIGALRERQAELSRLPNENLFAH